MLLSITKQLLFLIVITIVYCNEDKKSGSFCTTPNGSSGVCIAFRKCESLIDQIKQQTVARQDLEKYRCGFEVIIKFK